MPAKLQHILIVDDDDSNRLLMSLALQKESEHIHQAESARAALQIIDTQAIDLAIIDLELPDIHGLEIVTAIRQKQHTYIVVSTAVDTPQIIQDACQKGASAYIIKPFEIADLIRFIKESPLYPRLPHAMVVIANRGELRMIKCE